MIVVKGIIRQIFKEHWKLFSDKYGTQIRKVVIEEVEKMINCGNIENGHRKYKCLECGHVKLVGFTCKSRICTSCGTVKMDDFAEELKGRLINTTHRHIVFTIPKELRNIFREDRNRLKILVDGAAEVIKSWYCDMNKGEEYMPGIVAVIHTFGRDLKYNPHIHILMTEGGMGNTKGWKRVDFIPYNMLRKRWQAAVLKGLEKKLGKRRFREMKKRLYGKLKEGFYVNAKRRVKNDKEIIKYIGRYTGRPAIAESRIISYDGEKVTYCYERHEDGEKVIEEVSAEEFIKKIIIHIPERDFKMVRYYGIYSRNNRHKGKFVHMVKEVVMKELRKLMNWRWRMIKAFNKDPMECEKCKSKMILYEIMVKINGEAIYIDTKEKREYEQRKAEEIMMQTYELYRVLGANGDIKV